MKHKRSLFKKKYYFTNSALVFLSSFPLFLCSLGFYGMAIRDFQSLDTQSQIVLGAICLFPSLLVLIVLAKFESSRHQKIAKKKQRVHWAQNYSKNIPINNGDGLLSDDFYKNKPKAKPVLSPVNSEPERVTILPGLTVPVGENPFRPITDESIDETLEQLARAKEKHERGAA